METSLQCFDGLVLALFFFSLCKSLRLLSSPDMFSSRWTSCLMATWPATDSRRVRTHVVLDEAGTLQSPSPATRKEMFYSMTHSTHFIYGYMASDHSDSERGNPLPPHGLLFPISSKASFICTIPDWIIHTFGKPVIEPGKRNSSVGLP